MTDLDYLTAQETSTYLKEIHASRDRAIVLLFLTTGIFLHEIVELTVESIDWKKRTISILGKRKRTLPLNAETYDALAQWSQERLNAPEPALFLTTKGTVKALETRGVDTLLRKYSASNGLNKHVNAHTLRNTFAIRLFEQPGMTRRTAKALLGVSDTDTLKRYEGLSKRRDNNHQTEPSQPLDVALPDNRSLLSKTLSRFFPKQPKEARTPTPARAVDPESIFVGRDHLVAEVRASLNKGQSLLLTGTLGIGKTHFLKHMAEHYQNNALFIPTPSPLKSVLLEIIAHTHPNAPDTPTTRDPLADVLEYLITNKTLSPPILMIDNLHKLRAGDVDTFVDLMDHFTILGATEDDSVRLKSVWWKFKEIPLKPLSEPATQSLVTELTRHLIVTDADMLQNRIHSLSNGNPLAIVELSKQLNYKPAVTQDVIRSLHHEAGMVYRDWSIALVFFWGVLVMFRFIALGTHSFEGYILAGFGTSFLLVIRVLLARMK